MNLETLAIIAFVLAAIPCGLFLLNLSIYQPLVNRKSPIVNPVSVLIPARNEEKNIRSTLESVLTDRDCEFEVIVLDDHSTDGTARIVEEFAAKDFRVRLEVAPPLPDGWCGKQHACHVLAKRARYPLLVFIDADVRLAPDALVRMTNFMEQSKSALASGVPRQELGTFLERLLIPQIHFVLLGFLPMHAMRWTRWAAFSAGCGQLFIARRDAYEQCGGHAMLRDSLHDGVKLPRVFRKAGFRTGLFDATDLATCRMYQTNGETWRGLGKNATEGLAAPSMIIPMTILLALGQILPFALLFFAAPGSRTFDFAVLGSILALLPRLISARLYRQSWLGATVHPIGVLLLLAIQWQALFRRFFGQPMQWKGRNYMHTKTKSKMAATCIAAALMSATIFSPVTVHAESDSKPPASTLICPNFAMEDQFGTNHSVKFPNAQPTVLIVADKKGSEQINAWVHALKSSYQGRVGLIGVADVGGVPGPMQKMVSKKFRKKFPHTILLDWTDALPTALPCVKDMANIFLLDKNGRVLVTEKGECKLASLQRLTDAAELALGSKPK